MRGAQKTAPLLKKSRPSKKELEISLYPNPANNVLFVEWDWFKSGINGALTFRIFNQLGQCKGVVELVDFQRNNYKINLDSYPSGVYHLEIESEGRVIDVKQVVKI